jgi:hypothetical protein
MAARPRERRPTPIPGEPCTHCGAPVEPHSSGVESCTVCVRWRSMRSRAARRGENFSLTLREFAQWFALQSRHCHYCQIAESELAALGIKNQTGLRVVRLGVDRLIGEQGYTQNNMTLACFVCNRTKSDWYTAQEMQILGLGIARVWAQRLGGTITSSTAATAPTTMPAQDVTQEKACAEVACRTCASPFEAHTTRTPLCTVCVRFRSLRGNARRVRRDGTNPELGWDLQAFAAWFARQQRNCTHCQIDEAALPSLKLPTQVGHPLARLGVDRLENIEGYNDTNAVLCCLACNRIRSATFTQEEMRLIAPFVRELWSQRLDTTLR